jgi:Ion channel
VSQPRRRLERRREQARDRFGVLLLLLIGSFVALGFADDTWARVLAGVLQLSALLFCFLVTSIRQNHRWLGLFALLGVVAVVLVSIEGDIPSGLGQLAGVVVLGALLVAILGRVLRHEHVTMQTLYGAVCAYFLIGLIFSSLYGAMNDFADAPIFGEPVGRSVFSYFSFTTLTTVGFGDYTAVTDLGRRVAVMEAVIGQVFIATTLARLVSLYKSGGSDAAGSAST